MSNEIIVAKNINFMRLIQITLFCFILDLKGKKKRTKKLDLVCLFFVEFLVF